jgi:hypothetical protein
MRKKKSPENSADIQLEMSVNMKEKPVRKEVRVKTRVNEI